MLKGRKFDQGKPDWSLLPLDQVEHIVHVLTYGANKYTQRVLCQTKHEVAKIVDGLCSCGKTTNARNVILIGDTPLKDCASSATLRNTLKQNELLATQTASLILGVCAGHATTECLKAKTLSTRTGSETTLPDGCTLTGIEELSGTKDTDQGDELKQETSCGQGSVSSCASAYHLSKPPTFSNDKEINAPSAEETQAGSWTSTTTMRPAGLEDFYATDAIRDLALSETLSRLLSEHSPICAAQKLRYRAGELVISGRDNWKQLDNQRQRYFAAAMRHLTQWQSGKILDEESGQHHLAHAACNLLFLLWNEDNEHQTDKQKA